jgi:hypothetical protein
VIKHSTSFKQPPWGKTPQEISMGSLAHHDGQEDVVLLRSRALSQAIHGLVCRGRFDETRNIQARDLGRYARTRSVNLLPALCTARIAKVPGTNTRRDFRCQRESPVPNRYSMYKFLRKGTEVPLKMWLLALSAEQCIFKGPPVLSRHRILHMS